MGLDISAYSNLEYIETIDIEEWEDRYWMRQDDMPFETVMAYHWIDEYADRATPIVENGVYKINGETHAFRAGSYIGYNIWREQLSFMATGLNPRTIWDNEDRYRGVPFFELINFSDSEGIIGPTVAAKLAVDFAAYQEKADRHPDDYFRKKYADWRKAFELAADGGMVAFH